MSNIGQKTQTQTVGGPSPTKQEPTHTPGLHATSTVTNIPSIQSEMVMLRKRTPCTQTGIEFIKLPEDLRKTLNLSENPSRKECINAAKTCSDDNVKEIFRIIKEHVSTTSKSVIFLLSNITNETEALQASMKKQLSKEDQVYARSFFSAVKERLRAIRKALSGDNTAVHSKNEIKNHFAIVNAFTELKKKCENSKFVYSAATLVKDISKLVDTLLTIILGGKPYVRQGKAVNQPQAKSQENKL